MLLLLTRKVKNYVYEITRLMAVMGLGVKCGQTVEVEVTGADKETAYEAMKQFFEKNL